MTNPPIPFTRLSSLSQPMQQTPNITGESSSKRQPLTVEREDGWIHRYSATSLATKKQEEGGWVWRGEEEGDCTLPLSRIPTCHSFQLWERWNHVYHSREGRRGGGGSHLSDSRSSTFCTRKAGPSSLLSHMRPWGMAGWNLGGGG